jgi:hypothetical protein
VPFVVILRVHMLIQTVIYIRSKEDVTRSIHYDFDQSEYERVRADYESYLKEGNPTSGHYTCRATDSPMATLKRLVLHFDKIEKIVPVEIESEGI